jgi:hypothetical protein
MKFCIYIRLYIILQKCFLSYVIGQVLKKVAVQWLQLHREWEGELHTAVLQTLHKMHNTKILISVL